MLIRNILEESVRKFDEVKAVKWLKKKEIMEKCFECYCDNGLRNTGIKELGK